MEQEQETFQTAPNLNLNDSGNVLTQLQQLAMLYHSRGRIAEAQEIYQLIVQIRNTGSSSSKE
jgi:hypothetical protein